MPKVGYVLPTREYIMTGRPEAGPLFDLAARAEALGFDSVWVGDSIIARPRHEALTLLAAIAVRAPTLTIGTAVLLPVLRNPVVLAHQIATLDQISEGRLIIGVGVGPDTPGVRAEHAAAGVPFEKRTGALLEGLRLCRALWSGEAVDWDGRWNMSGAVLAPVPHRPGGPPLWMGGSAPRVRERAGRIFDGWIPVSPNAAQWGEHWAEIRDHANDAGRDPGAPTGAVCLNLSIDDEPAVANRQLDTYLAQYYGVPDGTAPRQTHGSYAGPAAGAAEWLDGFARAGVDHFVLRFAGNNERHLETVASLKSDLGW
ncbi:MAG: LLM class flavin-dependent oxidoreductase [Rhodospirillaceae bacterium]|jgi:alkanesulfonate monooxygenase SsuD/methylene tetrahydromethanopterin reductase-like flavin-dependent oxidoreductase (luciferase family)|nr:LLM class flavin-dependent oxidoreductase [Rhodospirillaceae bacterium]MBT5459074.1 LLM class flavin-dependent oxidoreductase [Rhodospirillaceae bacterium]